MLTAARDARSFVTGKTDPATYLPATDAWKICLSSQDYQLFTGVYGGSIYRPVGEQDYRLPRAARGFVRPAGQSAADWPSSSLQVCMAS